jgi:hypothetical protein
MLYLLSLPLAKGNGLRQHKRGFSQKIVSEAAGEIMMLQHQHWRERKINTNVISNGAREEIFFDIQLKFIHCRRFLSIVQNDKFFLDIVAGFICSVSLYLTS